jgi:hypothetical protein
MDRRLEGSIEQLEKLYLIVAKQQEEIEKLKKQKGIKKHWFEFWR